MIKHLSTAQISEWIAGERAQENQRHLQGCAACRAELAAFESGLVALGQSVRHWAAQQDAVPSLEIRAPRGLAGVSWRWALAAAAIGAVALLPIRWNSEARREAALQQDAEFLEHIHTQLSRAVPATMEPLMILMQEGKDEHQ